MKEFKEFVSVIVGLIIGAAVMALALFVWQRSGEEKTEVAVPTPPAVNAHDRIDGARGAWFNRRARNPMDFANWKHSRNGSEQRTSKGRSVSPGATGKEI